MDDAPQRLQSLLAHRYFVRFHMGLMLGGVILSGVWASVLLRWAGLLNPALRYPLAVAVSYLVFFVLIRIWLEYVEITSPAARGSEPSRGFDLSGIGSGGTSWGGSSGSSSSAGGLVGRGGDFGGGGASTGFEDAAVGPQPIVVPVPDTSAPALHASAATSSARSGSSGRSSRSGGGGGGDGLGILIALAVLVAAVCGAGIYLVYQAPAILSEAAFHAALLPGLFKVARSAHDESWERGLLGSTWIPFGIVLIVAAVLGGVIRHNCPDAVTLHQALTDCPG